MYPKDREELSVRDLIAAHEEEFWDSYREGILRQEWETRSIVSPRWLDEMAPIIARHFADTRFASAAGYLFKSIADLWWDMCDWREEGYRGDFRPYLTQAEAEAAFLNAFKAVEALIGEPGSVERVQQSLRQIGVNPKEEFLFGKERIQVAHAVRACLGTRDKVAAHGSRQNKRELTLPGIFRLQALARHLLLFAPETGL